MIYCLEDLGQKITENLEQGRDLASLAFLVKNYKGKDWLEYQKFSEHNYTRNRCYQNDSIEILLICWNKNQTSGIHDHPNNGCLLKIIEGELSEEIFEKINDDLILLKSQNNNKDHVSFLQGQNGLHNIKNTNQLTTSLHVYSPPNYKAKFYKKEN